MNSSHINRGDVLFEIYRNRRTVFRLNDIAMLTGSSDFQSLNKKLNYYVRTGKLLNPRKGVYTKTEYDPEELACNIFTPSYLSLEYVLQKSGIVFQYDSRLTLVSYLTRSIEIAGETLQFRKVKGEILVNSAGVNQLEGHISMATPERALLDVIYLDRDYYFDNLHPINRKLIYKLLPVYQSKKLTERVKSLLKDD